MSPKKMNLYIKSGDEYTQIRGIKEVKVAETVWADPTEYKEELGLLPTGDFSITVPLPEDTMKTFVRIGMFSPLYRIAMRKPS